MVQKVSRFQISMSANLIIAMGWIGLLARFLDREDTHTQLCLSKGWLWSQSEPRCLHSPDIWLQNDYVDFCALPQSYFSIDHSNPPNRCQKLILQPDHIVWDHIQRIFESGRWVSCNPWHKLLSRAMLIFYSVRQSEYQIDHPMSLEVLENLDLQPDDIVLEHIKRIFESVQWVSRNPCHKLLSQGWQFWRIWAGFWMLTQLDFEERATAY